MTSEFFYFILRQLLTLNFFKNNSCVLSISRQVLFFISNLTTSAFLFLPKQQLVLVSFQTTSVFELSPDNACCIFIPKKAVLCFPQTMVVFLTYSQKIPTFYFSRTKAVYYFYQTIAVLSSPQTKGFLYFSPYNGCVFEITP